MRKGALRFNCLVAEHHLGAEAVDAGGTVMREEAIAKAPTRSSARSACSSAPALHGSC